MIYNIYTGKNHQLLGKLIITRKSIELKYADGGTTNFDSEQEIRDLIRSWRQDTEVILENNI